MDIANVSINADLHKQWALCHHVVFDDFQTLRQKLKSSCTAEQFGSLQTGWIPSFIVELDQYIRNLELANDLRLAERAPRIPCKPETLARLKYALGTVRSVDDLQVNGPQISRDFEFEFSLIHQWYLGLCGGENLPDPPDLVVDSDYSEPYTKSELALMFEVSNRTIARRIKDGTIPIMPGTAQNARRVRVHCDHWPKGLKLPHERKNKIPAGKAKR